MKFDMASYNIISRLKDIIEDFEKTEANRPKAECVSAACSPATQSLPRSPDRQSFAEFRTWAKEKYRFMEERSSKSVVASILASEYKSIVDVLEIFDRGDGHSSHPAAGDGNQSKPVKPSESE